MQSKTVPAEFKVTTKIERIQQVIGHGIEIRVIARQHLVGSLTIQQDRNSVLFRESHHAPLRIYTRGREWLLLMPKNIAKLFKELFGSGPDVVPLNSIALCNEIHPLAFIAGWIIKPRGKRLLHRS